MVLGYESKRFTIYIRNRAIDLAFWLKMAAIVILLFAIPFEFHYYEAVQPVPAPPYYDIWFSSVTYDYIDWRGRQEVPFKISEPITIAAAAIICIPGILLNHRLRNRDPSTSARDAGIASGFATYVLSIYMVNYFPPNQLDWLFPASPSWKLLLFGSLVAVTLIIIPILIREASHRGFQWRHRILASIIGLFSTLVPVVLVVGFPGGWNNYQIIAPGYQFWYESTVPSMPWHDIDQFSMDLSVHDVMNLLYLLAYTGFGVIFGVYILRYIRRQISKRRVFFVGAISILIPYAFFVYRSTIFDTGYPVMVIPIPILFLFGISVLVFSEPIALDAKIRKDLFYDSLTPEETITVPVLYLMKSKLMSVKNRIRRKRDTS